MNNRRKPLVALGAGVFTASLGGFAQQPGKIWRIGFLATVSASVLVLRPGWTHCGQVCGSW